MNSTQSTGHGVETSGVEILHHLTHTWLALATRQIGLTSSFVCVYTRLLSASRLANISSKMLEYGFTYTLILWLGITIGIFPPVTTAYHLNTLELTSTIKFHYNQPHSLTVVDRAFDPRDGWQSVNISNLRYKYVESSPHREAYDNSRNTGYTNRLRMRQSRIKAINQKKSGQKNHSLKAKTSHMLQSAWKGLKAIGTSQAVVVTWCARLLAVYDSPCDYS